jgi:hypothetical protein
MLTGPEGLRRAIVRAASASVGNGSASFFSPQAAVGNLRVSQTECPPGYETRITNIANLPASSWALPTTAGRPEAESRGLALPAPRTGHRWIDGHNQLPKLIQGVKFTDGILPRLKSIGRIGREPLRFDSQPTPHSTSALLLRVGSFRAYRESEIFYIKRNIPERNFLQYVLWVDRRPRRRFPQQPK